MTSISGVKTVPFSNSEIAGHMWLFTGGAIIVLLQSIVSEAKRKWWSLLIGCIFGGLGAWTVGQLWPTGGFWVFNSNGWKYVFMGMGAVMAENFLNGFQALSKQFAETPVKFATHMAKVFLPSFGKEVGNASEDINVDELK